MCSALFGNIDRNTVSSYPSMLQIALALLVAAKKYNKIRNYKTSAAAGSNFLETEINDKQGSKQGICDIYDTNVSLQNGLKTTHFLAIKTTHFLAMIITRSTTNYYDNTKPAIPRLKTSHILHIPYLQYHTSRTSHIRNIPHPNFQHARHSTSPTSHIPHPTGS